MSAYTADSAYEDTPEYQWENADQQALDALQSPAYLEWAALMEEEQELAALRVGKPAPLRWGSPMGPDHYFCTACWRMGDKYGKHPYDTPPCHRTRDA